MGLWPVSSLVAPVMISTYSRRSMGLQIAVTATLAPVADTIFGGPTACLFWPFRVPDPIVAVKMWTYNGALAGNIDVGIYKPDGTRLVSSGTTAQANANALQEFNITDTPLGVGNYYFGLGGDNDGGFFCIRASGSSPDMQFLKLYGMLYQATYPLPATAAWGALGVPVGGPAVMGLSARALVV